MNDILFGGVKALNPDSFLSRGNPGMAGKACFWRAFLLAPVSRLVPSGQRLAACEDRCDCAADILIFHPRTHSLQMHWD